MKLSVHFQPVYSGRTTPRYTNVEIEVPDGSICLFKQEHGCLVIEERGGNVLAAFMGVKWFSRTEPEPVFNMIKFPDDDKENA